MSDAEKVRAEDARKQELVADAMKGMFPTVDGFDNSPLASGLLTLTSIPHSRYYRSTLVTHVTALQVEAYTRVLGGRYDGRLHRRGYDQIRHRHQDRSEVKGNKKENSCVLKDPPRFSYEALDRPFNL